jgi:GLPGLI family protein
VKAMMPKTMVLTIKGDKSRSEMVMGMGKTVAISNAETKESIALIDMMGQKIAVKSTPEEIQEEISGSPKMTVETTDETKDILGYMCNKAIIKSDEGTQIIVYYTKELGTGATYFDDPQFKDITGLMLEFEIPNEGMSMKFTAITVESKNVADTEFEIPEGYQIKTKEEMKGMFGGGM